MGELNVNRPFYLPRLPREYYAADAVVHWTLPIAHRRRGWLDQRLHAAFREAMLHTAAREGLFCPAYCLMPDHLHLIWMGLRLDSDQLNGMTFLRTHLEPKLAPHKFQHQAHDHVLKTEERRHDAFARACHYILENPLRAELVKHSIEWEFSGAVVPAIRGCIRSRKTFGGSSGCFTTEPNIRMLERSCGRPFRSSRRQEAPFPWKKLEPPHVGCYIDGFRPQH